MSSEIVPANPDGSSHETPSTADTGKFDSNVIGCIPQGISITKDIRPLDMLDLSRYGNRGVTIDLIGGKHQMRHFLSPDKGHKYVTRFNPTPGSVGPLLHSVKEPSVLWLRGCELLLQADFPFEIFKTLTALEISSVTHLTFLPIKPISEMTQLQSLNLSYLPIQQLPEEDFFSKLTNLRSLILSGCSSLHSLPKISELTALECLDLSDLLIETLPDGFFSDLKELRWLILRGCCKLRSLPSTKTLTKLELLDISYSALCSEPDLSSSFNFTHLFFRDAKVAAFDIGKYTCTLQVLDLSGARAVKYVRLKRMNSELIALDLSRTGIESIDFLSNLIYLHYLILRDCPKLVRLPTMEELTDLEVLDVSGCEMLGDLPEGLSNLSSLKELNLSGCSGLTDLREGLFDQMSCLEKLDLSKTKVTHLPSLANFINLQTLNLSQTSVENVPDLSNLINLKDFVPPKSDETDFSRGHLSKLENLQEVVGDRDGNIHPICVQGRISKHNELHLVSTFLGSSGFDRFKQGFDKLVDLISKIQRNFRATSPNSINSDTPVCANNVDFSIRSEAFKRHFRTILADLKYILDNIGLLESSPNFKSGEELLGELMDAADRLQAEDFPLDSTNLNELLRMVAKLKVLVPLPKQVDDLEKKKTDKKKKSRLTTKSKDKEEDAANININKPTEVVQNRLLSSYESLTDIQRNCLLYFVVFPCSMPIKERILIQLWYGEGFLDPQQEENIALSNPNPETSTITRTGPTTKDANTVEDIGRQILKVLREKEFIMQLVRGKVVFMGSYAHSFVTARAKEKCFFNFDHESGKLTPHLIGSERASLLKSQDNFQSSCKRWVNANSHKKLKCFSTIHTLFNVNDPIIDIKVEWFSKMTNLFVLHLGSWGSENEEPIEVLDFKFLEELKNMKQLRLLSLKGFSAMVRLPYSVCELTNLRILDLRDCGYVEELPAGIGSLQNLTHLDLTDCRLLSMLPKGIRLLSKVEVLKGFMNTYEADGQQNRKACTLRDLLKLKSLRKLNLVVNRDKFPYNEDIQVFKAMKNLCNLKITWENNYSIDQEPQDESLMKYSRWSKLKCWEQLTHQNYTEELLKSNHLDNLKKLVLCCFPSETAPTWLDPNELLMLEKLYFLGGNLKTLPPDKNKWNVKILHFKYLRNMYMDWPILRFVFPRLTYLEKHKCDCLLGFPCDRMGVWTIDTEKI